MSLLHNTSTLLKGIAIETETIISETKVKNDFNKNNSNFIKPLYLWIIKQFLIFLYKTRIERYVNFLKINKKKHQIIFLLKLFIYLY